jgi:hypothetical protein
MSGTAPSTGLCSAWPTGTPAGPAGSGSTARQAAASCGSAGSPASPRPAHRDQRARPANRSAHRPPGYQRAGGPGGHGTSRSGRQPQSDSRPPGRHYQARPPGNCDGSPEHPAEHVGVGGRPVARPYTASGLSRPSRHAPACRGPEAPMTSLGDTSRHAGGRPGAGPPTAPIIVRLQGALDVAAAPALRERLIGLSPRHQAAGSRHPQVLAGGMAAGDQRW